MSEQNQHAEELFDKLSKDKKKRRRKVIRTVVILILAVAVALVIIVGMLRRNVEARFASNVAEVQEYQVSTGTIHTVVAGSGVLTEVDQEQLTVPAGVKVTEVVAEAGDVVSKGDLIATVDMATVMTALSDIQKQIKDLDEDISDAKGDEVSSTITAGVSGRVKRIYAQKDMDVSLCMAENGALAVISLDGYMAVDLNRNGDKLTVGETVDVQLADGSFIQGKVESVAGGKATVLVTDNGPKIGEEVSVYSLDGEAICEGTLYVHNPLAVTGYAGTISGVSVQENGKVSRGTTVFRLKDTSFSANYDTLLRDRADLEEIQMELLTLYWDGAMLSPMDGRISSVEFNEDIGSTAGFETNVLTLFPDIAMSITISIDETDILALEEGQKAQIQVSSVSEEQQFPATVTEISKVADTSTGVTRYAAEVTLSKAAGMLPGMTADVDIQIEGVENALIIPVDALHQTSAIYYVYTSYDPETNQYGGMTEVTIGMQNDTQVEILSGLTEGDLIYYTEAPENIFSFMMGQMNSMGGMGGTPAVRPSSGDTVTFTPGAMPSGMGMPGMNRGG